MELVPGFVALLQELSVTMTAPASSRLTTALTGWVFDTGSVETKTSHLQSV